MKRFLPLPALLAALISLGAYATGIAVPPPPAAKSLSGAEKINYGDIDFFLANGWWYRLYNKMYEPVAPPVGIEVGTLPAAAKAVKADGRDYRLLNGVYYLRDGKHYTVVEAPRSQPMGKDDPAAHPDAPLYITPRNGQSREQQATDRAACEAWTVRVYGFDPGKAHRELKPAELDRKRGEYRRGLMSCMDGHGYSLM
jgi:hypothetical protein